MDERACVQRIFFLQRCTAKPPHLYSCLEQTLYKRVCKIPNTWTIADMSTVKCRNEPFSFVGVVVYNILRSHDVVAMNDATTVSQSHFQRTAADSFFIHVTFKEGNSMAAPFSMGNSAVLSFASEKSGISFSENPYK